VTIKEIAQLAGVSRMTVSNVINKKYSKVSKKTVEKVNAIIEENNYIPNLSARNLSAQSSKIIAIIVPLVYGNDSLFSDPYTAQIVGILENNLRNKGYFAMIRSVKALSDTVTFLNSWNIDGAIFIFPKPEINVKQLLKQVSTEMVFIDSYQEVESSLVINIDDYKGTYLATKYLIEKGHKKIGFAAPKRSNNLMELRYRGYEDALKQFQIDVNSSYFFESDISLNSGIKIGKQIAKEKKLTAVITTADVVAIGIIDGARSENCRIPDDLSVIGFDNLTIANYCYPKLTTVNQDINKKAELAISLLFDRIEKKNELPNKIKLDVALIERESVKPLN
jgi:LacI family transcriptional regulator